MSDDIYYITKKNWSLIISPKYQKKDRVITIDKDVLSD